MGNYSYRLSLLATTCKIARKENEVIRQSKESIEGLELQSGKLRHMLEDLKTAELIIAAQESKWQDYVLRHMEEEINRELAIVFPEDGYIVSLSADVSRGRVRLTPSVSSYFVQGFGNDVDGTQGRLFQQVLSFASIVSIMMLVGVSTVYVDEAFAGVAEDNKDRISDLVSDVISRGVTLVCISQTDFFSSLICNKLELNRTVDNKTVIRQVCGDAGTESTE